ncbi:MAG: arsenate reductase family protein [Caulobacteraceae bacterium]|nr:arsenate reductase family protein [Caulobacteraceae bacterium]
MSDPDFPIVIFHNPACGTSRNVVAMVRAAGYEPTIVEYLQTGWSQHELLGLAARAGLGLKALLRTKGTPAEALGLLAEDVTAAEMVEAMLAHPILVNRPLVETPKGVKLCRPSEVVFDLLERKPDVFVKEDGEIVRL